MNNKTNCSTDNNICIVSENNSIKLINITDETINRIKEFRHLVYNNTYYLTVKTKLCAERLEDLILFHSSLNCDCKRCIALGRSYYRSSVYRYLPFLELENLGNRLDNNIITEYILLEIFGFEWHLHSASKLVFSDFINNTKNLHYNEIKPEINNIIKYMLSCTSNYRNSIIKDNVMFTKDIFNGIKHQVKKLFFKEINTNLYSIAKINVLFVELEKNLFVNV